jgi:ribosome-binding protein aMBF1 (putative translation factor)
MANLAALRKPRAATVKLRRGPDAALGRLIRDLVRARGRAGLTQEQVASRMRTTASAISRLESSKISRSTLTTIENYALVVGCQVSISVRARA